jgi:RND superfamily putative drug exporter
MFLRLGEFTSRHPLLVCALWVSLGLALTLAAPSWDTHALDDDIGFLPARCDSVRGYKLLSRAYPQDVFASRAVLAFERADRALDTDDFLLIDRCVAALHQLRQDESALKLGRIISYRDPYIGKRLVSADGHCSLVQVSLGTPFLALQTRTSVDGIESCVRGVCAEAKGEGPRLLITGAAGVGRDLIQASGAGLERTTLASVVLVVLILLLVYRAPLLALVPLVIIAASVWVALKGLALLTLIPGIYLINISQIFAIVLLYGAGTDYCLFLISRYQEERASGSNPSGAVQRSVGHVGGTVLASAGTVVWGLGLMGLAEFTKVRCAGPAIALSLIVALLASLTLTPALLSLLGSAVFWPYHMPVQAGALEANCLWNRVSRLVAARPATVLGATILLLLPLAVLGFRLKADYRPTGELTPKTPSILGLEMIQRHFPAGETGPLTVLVTSATDWNSPEGRDFIAYLSRGLSRLENVVEVRSLTQPLGRPVPDLPVLPCRDSPSLLGALLRSVQQSASEAREAADRSAREFYLAMLPTTETGAPIQYVTRLDLVLGSDPFAPASIATLNVLQSWLRDEIPPSRRALSNLSWECYGVTVNARDLAQVTEGDRQRVNFLVVGGIFVILVLVVRRVWLAAYLLLSVLFSYLATLGVTALMGLLWTGAILTTVNWRVPFFLFTILVAVGEDYNILIISRILHERQRFDAENSVRRALARTGKTITSCGLIMAGTFGTLMLAGLDTLVQTGFALAFGVLLDTFVVRPLLVPAFTLLVWRSKRTEAKRDGVSFPGQAQVQRAA